MNIPTVNTGAFLWHALFLALAKNFMDMDIILPAMIIDAGGASLHVGMLTAIMTGGTQLSLLVFTPFLSRQAEKKRMLLSGITLRIFILFGISGLFLITNRLAGTLIVWMLLAGVAAFSVGGAFANIGYVDILGKSVASRGRKRFFSVKQVLSSGGVLISALLARQVIAGHLYPDNYRLLFLYAAVLLTVASAGFWLLREESGTSYSIPDIRSFFRQIKDLLKQNPRLKHYIFLLNTQGLVLALMPFLVLFVKTVHQAEGGMIGNYLLLKVGGSVAAGIFVYYFSSRAKYHVLLHVATGLAILIAVMVIVHPGTSILFPLLFLLGGVALTFFIVSRDGILLEITTLENRAVLTGLVGAATLVPGVFSLLAAGIIHLAGLNILFSLFVLIEGISYYYIRKLDCRK